MNPSREQVLINALDVLTRQVDELKTRVENLASENDDLRGENMLLAKMIENLKKAPTLTDPIRIKLPVPTDSWYGNCPSCGLKLNQVMGYVCSNPNCPTGMGGVQCTVADPPGPGR